MPKQASPALPTIRAGYTPHNPSDYATHPEGESLTKQAFKEQCDINNILAKYQKTGVLDHIAMYEPHYGEMSGETYKEQLDQVTFAQTMFNDLPSAAREYFEHDPSKFLDFMDTCDPSDNSAVQKLKDLQLLDPQSTLWLEHRQVTDNDGAPHIPEAPIPPQPADEPSAEG